MNTLGSDSPQPESEPAPAARPEHDEMRENGLHLTSIAEIIDAGRTTSTGT